VPIFVGGGLPAACLAWLVLLYALAMMDKAMYSERDVEKYLKLPVLTSVPSQTQRLRTKTD
jgi:capsular polysaccharide biosynthesis protein